MKNKSLVHRISKILVDVLFYFGILAVIAVPWWSKFLSESMFYTEAEWYMMMGVLMLTGACAVYILFVIKGMYKTLLGENPFVSENVSAFRKVAVASALIALVYLIKCVFLFSVATLVIVIIFSVATLFCLTLKDIFKQAVCYKEENDWTV
ncbi:MAG: DUF2975 domain-containing protein [Clostridia bacterium]|nr:DUF2975 domain-containing protein [Clostridia bacterium]